MSCSAIQRCRAFFYSCLTSAVVTSCVLTPASAQNSVGGTGTQAMSPGQAEQGHSWAVSILFDNDYFAGTDSSYTGGFRLAVSHIAPPDELYLIGQVQRAQKGLADLLFPPVPASAPGGAPFQTRESFGFGFSIFTPEDTSATDPPVDERPYGSSIYALYGLEQDYQDPTLGGAFLLSSKFFSNLEIQAGMIGPEPGEAILNGFHAIWPAGGTAEGWASRHINYEPALNIFYNRVWSGFPVPRLFRGLWSDEDIRSWENPIKLIPDSRVTLQFRPHIGFALGNVYTYGAGGLTVRAGYNIPDNIGPPTIRPAAPGGDYFVAHHRKAGEPPVSAYLFAGIEERAVLYNAFLDGNLLSESPSVDKKPFVQDLNLGGVLELGNWRLAYTRAFRSSEFDGQGSTGFGAVSLGYTRSF